jgi:hypothetical protein
VEVYLWVGEAFLCVGIERLVSLYDLKDPLFGLCWLRDGSTVGRLFWYMCRKKLALDWHVMEIFESCVAP